jgi:hypothetical protein
MSARALKIVHRTIPPAVQNELPSILRRTFGTAESAALWNSNPLDERGEPPPVMHAVEMEYLREVDRWRSHVESQRARASHMRESRCVRANIALFERAQNYRTTHLGCGRTGIIKALHPRADKTERRKLVARLKRLDDRVRREGDRDATGHVSDKT